MSQSFSQGNITMTGNNLDVAIQGNGFFQVTMPDGTLNYTRDGSFQIDAQGRLVTATGHPVANGVTVPANAKGVRIADDGTVTAMIPGNVAPQPIGTIALANFVNPAGLDPRGQNLLAILQAIKAAGALNAELEVI